MEKKKVYEEIDIKKEQPVENGRYYIRCEGGFEDGGICMNKKFLGEQEIGGVTHWLKEQELYVFDKLQMEDVVLKAVMAGMKIGLAGYDWKTAAGTAMMVEYVESLDIK